MGFYITIPFNILTYRKVLDNYWSGKSDNNGSLGFFKKVDKGFRKYYKYMFGGRVPVSCLDYEPPFSLLPSMQNEFIDWAPTIVDDMILHFKTGEAERMCSRYAFMIDELEDNEIIVWEEYGRKMVGAFDSSTGGLSVCIPWGLSYVERVNNKKFIKKNQPWRVVDPPIPRLEVKKELRIDLPEDYIPVTVNWVRTSKDCGQLGIRFAGSIEKGVLGELIEKRLKTHMITLKRYLKKKDFDSAVKLGNWINRLKEILKKCKYDKYRV